MLAERAPRSHLHTDTASVVSSLAAAAVQATWKSAPLNSCRQAMRGRIVRPGSPLLQPLSAQVSCGGVGAPAVRRCPRPASGRPPLPRLKALNPAGSDGKEQGRRKPGSLSC